jgi:hypothetical protein
MPSWVVAACGALLFQLAAANLIAAEPGQRKAIVIVAPTYWQAIDPWVQRRRGQGFEVEVVNPLDVIGSHRGADAVARLRDAIERQATFDGATSISDPETFVLLVGDAPGPSEPLDPTRLLPAAIETEKSRPSAPRRFASDNTYGLPDSRGAPRLAVGRWPVRSADEVATQVEKSLRYETAQTPGLHRRTVTFLATTPNYNPTFDPVLERMAMGMIDAQVKPHWGLRAVYSSPLSVYFPGPDETARQVRRWFEDATPITLFAGHGYDRGVDMVRFGNRNYRVLDSDLAEQIRGEPPGTVLWMSTCSCGDFDLPPPECGLAESLVRNPHGPTAVVAGSDVTSAYANLLLCLGLSSDVLEDPPEHLGTALVRVKRAMFRPGPPLLKNMLLAMEPCERPEFLPADHQYLYNLLGDPTLELRLPRRLSGEISASEGPRTAWGLRWYTISGTIKGLRTPTAHFSLVPNRLATKVGPAASPVNAEADGRDTDFFARFTAANGRVARSEWVALTDGQFKWPVLLRDDTAAALRWVQVYAHTDPADAGGWSDAVGAWPFRLPTESAPADR